MNAFGRHDPARDGRAPSSGDAPGEAEAKLLPILDRVLTLGRGPLGLVRWVKCRVGDLGYEQRDANPGIARRLARELAGLLHRGSGFETLAFAAGETIVMPPDRRLTSGSPARPCR